MPLDLMLLPQGRMAPPQARRRSDGPHQTQGFGTRGIVWYEVIRFTIRGCTLAIHDEAPTVELDRDARNIITRLTGRELQVFGMIAQGDTAKNVAHKLRISEWTVGTHLRRIFAKLGVDNQAAMVYRCALLIDSALRTEPEAQRAPASED